MVKLLRQCVVCWKLADDTGTYRKFLPTCPYIPISHGYCPDCLTNKLCEIRARKAAKNK